MNTKQLLAIAALFSLFHFSCGSSSSQGAADSSQPSQDQPAAQSTTDNAGTNTGASASTDDKGIGKFTDVKLTHPLDKAMIAKGKDIYEVKCSACHKLTDEKLVGPGWKGVTDRRKPEWIMNFVTNTDEMLNKDANAQALMEVCMVRMPNQHLTDEEARQVLEFMRKNDSKN